MKKNNDAAEWIENNIFFNLEKDNSGSTCQTLLALLPSIAKVVIPERIENDHFRQNPDDPNEHAAMWHQFGIITHTSFFLNAFQKEAQEFFKNWGTTRKINTKLNEQIDGKSKLELLQISIIFHDLGKFVRNFVVKDGKIEHNFSGHEALSEKLIEENRFIYHLLNEQFKLTKGQIKYIARCAGLHFELGKSREAARKTKKGYSIAFADSEECQKSCDIIALQFPHFKEEIGILFLCDNLAKTDIRIEGETDEEIENQTQHIENILRERYLNPHLIFAIKQLPVSIAIARKYLESV